jgi:tetratricopeptide (TPR) repeat protein
MNIRAFVLFLAGAMLASVNVRAQTPDASAPAMDPAKVAEYQQRFQQGYDLEKAGKLEDARAIYDGILAEQPEAKRSLLEAGRVSLELNEPAKADVYLDKLHTIVPDFPEAIELLIQANEALKKNVKVERLVREFRALHDSGRAQGMKPYFVRERIKLDQGQEIVMSEFFDYTQAPYYAMQAELLDAQQKLKRLLILKYDPDGTAQVRAKDPKLAKDEVFILAEPIYSGERMTRIDVYEELMSNTDYEKARNKMLVIFAATPKPILSQKVDAPAQ